MPEIRTIVLHDGENIYTEEELQEAIKQENEKCALICDKVAERYIYSDPYDSDDEQEAISLCAEKIRARNR